MPLPAVALGIAKVGAIIGKGVMAAGKGLAAGAKAGARATSRVGGKASSKVGKKPGPKISRFNIKSILNKKKRLSKLQKVNERIKSNISNSELREKKEKNLESKKNKKKKTPATLKKALSKIGQVGGLLLAGIGMNAIFSMLDKTKKSADSMNKKVDSKWSSSRTERTNIENQLDKIDMKKLTADAKKFGIMIKNAEGDIPDVIDPKSTITIKNADGSERKITAEQFANLTGHKLKKIDKSSNNINLKNNKSSTNGITPLKDDNNLSSLLNNNDNKESVILARQQVIHE